MAAGDARDDDRRDGLGDLPRARRRAFARAGADAAAGGVQSAPAAGRGGHGLLSNAHQPDRAGRAAGCDHHQRESVSGSSGRIRGLGLQSQADRSTAAAILLAVNVSAILPATPSNVGVFQAACLVVLAAYGVAAGPAIAYGIILQAVEVVTALGLGVPALLRE